MSTLLHKGTSFLISDDLGNIQANVKADAGLYYEDSRFLSCYELRIDGGEPLLLSLHADSESEIRFFLTNRALRGPGKRLPPNSLSIVRTRRLRREFHEHIEIRHCGDGVARFNVQLAADADFEHIYFVKSSSEGADAPLPRHGVKREGHGRSRSVTMSYERGPVYRRCALRFSQAPRWKGKVANFSVQLHRGEIWRLDVATRMYCRRGEKSEKRETRKARASKQALTRSVRSQLERMLPVLETDHPVLRRAFQRACQDLISLRIKASESLPKAHAIAAGIPWYMALFGRDSLITSCQALWVDPTLAAGTLRALAFFQGKRRDSVSLEEPGKILHEYRESRIASRRREIPRFPYYGTVDATPLFLIALSEYTRWTGDLALARELWPNAVAALEWMRGEGDPDRDGFLEYTAQKAGLTNQGWKDSSDSIRFANGRIAKSPIALVEVQGYKVAALRRVSELARHLGNEAMAQPLLDEAESLSERIVARYWLKHRGFFAEALDHAKTPVDSITSNPGQLLWSESLEPRYAKRVAQRLFRPDLFSGFGIRTMGSSEGGFNPVSYHNGSVWPHDNSLILEGLMSYGFRAQALTLAEALLEALSMQPDYRFPELYAGFSRQKFRTLVGYPSACRPQAWASGSVVQLVRQVLGIRANALEDRFETEPLPLSGMSYLRLRGLRVGDRVLDVDAKIRGKLMHVRLAGQESPHRKAA